MADAAVDLRKHSSHDEEPLVGGYVPMVRPSTKAFKLSKPGLAI